MTSFFVAILSYGSVQPLACENEVVLEINNNNNKEKDFFHVCY